MLPHHSKSMSPPRYCDFLEELVVDDGTITLGLHLWATCRVRSAAHFDSIYFRPSYYCVYVLIGCTVTESKCSRITKKHLEFHIVRRRPTFKSLVSGVDRIPKVTV